MRCPKCHFVSFDHLDRCKKCGTDLSAERERLNLLNFEPAMPHFFGLLDQAELNLEAPAQPLAPTPGAALQAPEASPLEVTGPAAAPASIELILPDEPAGPAAEGAAFEPTAVRPDGAADLPELILDDRDQDAPLELSLDDRDAIPPERTVPERRPPAEEPIEFVLDDDELELELSQDEMERIILELNREGSGEPAPEPLPKRMKPPGSGENS